MNLMKKTRSLKSQFQCHMDLRQLLNMWRSGSLKTFGVHICPSGENKGDLKAIQDKAQG